MKQEWCDGERFPSDSGKEFLDNVLDDLGPVDLSLTGKGTEDGVYHSHCDSVRLSWIHDQNEGS